MRLDKLPVLTISGRFEGDEVQVLVGNDNEPLVTRQIFNTTQ
jgi:hypothetical protein